MPILKLAVGSRIVMKKKHPCGNDTFKVIRVGSDIRIVCLGCGRDITLPRDELEKKTKAVLSDNSES